MKHLFSILTAVFAVFAFFVSCGEKEFASEPEKKVEAEPKIEETVVQEQNEAAEKIDHEPVEKPKEEVNSEPEPVEKPKADKDKKVSGKKAAPRTNNSGKSETNVEPASEQPKPAEPDNKQMTDEERKQYIEDKKEEIEKTSEEVRKKMTEQDPAANPSNMTNDDRDKVKKDEKSYREKMNRLLESQKKNTSPEKKEEDKKN